MRVKILRSVGKKDTLPKSADNTSLELPAKDDGTMYQEGEVAEFNKEDAEKFIKSGVGEETKEPIGPPPKPPVQGVVPVAVVEDQTKKPAEKSK